jgi:hypothetical protein
MGRPAPGFAYSGSAKNRLSFNEVKMLAEAYGLPGTAIAQIARGESGLYADVQQRDPGDGMVGYGLLQMTPNAWGKGSAARKYMETLGGIKAMNDPAKNMAMARFLYKSAGNKLTPWYGTRFLTDRSGEGRLGPIDPSVARRVSGDTSASAANAGGGTASTRTTTTTTPGVDNSQARALLVQQFLGNKNSDVLDFALQARQLKDVAPTTATQTVKLPGSSSPDAASSNTGHDPSKFGTSHSPLLELIHKGGPGYAVKNGRKVDGSQFYASVWDGHADHVHVAAGPQTIVQLGRMAQEMGLNVGENPHFGGVAPVHVKGSYHYRGEAIDVSGDPGKMNEYAARVERLYGIKG